MTQVARKYRFKAKLLCPANPGKGKPWAFVILPKAISDKLPRRGRTTVAGTFNDHPFQATLQPDGELSHWLKVGQDLCDASGAVVGSTVVVEIAPLTKEPEPTVPSDLNKAFAASPEARRVWDATTTIARLDWIHWIESAKQSKTRGSRVESTCDMLSSGKKRVCCFDQSGFYSKSLRAPEAAEQAHVAMAPQAPNKTIKRTPHRRR